MFGLGKTQSIKLERDLYDVVPVARLAADDERLG